MRVAIAGAGSVGRAIAAELIADGHRVLLIDRRRQQYRPDLVPAAEWLLADACEVGTVERAGLAMCDVVVAATGDDKANLVFALLAKTQCHVGRVIARVNTSSNRWLFGPDWGVDVALSTPSAMVSLVEEAVTVGDVVELMTLQQGHGTLVGITLAADSAWVDKAVAEVLLPAGAAVVAVRRDNAMLVPALDTTLLQGDEVVLAASSGVATELKDRLRTRGRGDRPGAPAAG